MSLLSILWPLFFYYYLAGSSHPSLPFVFVSLNVGSSQKPGTIVSTEEESWRGWPSLDAGEDLSC